jgi:hypothetical protein
LLYFGARRCGGDNPEHVRGVRRVADLVVAFENDYVASHDCSLRKTTRSRMLD